MFSGKYTRRQRANSEIYDFRDKLKELDEHGKQSPKRNTYVNSMIKYPKRVFMDAQAMLLAAKAKIAARRQAADLAARAAEERAARSKKLRKKRKANKKDNSLTTTPTEQADKHSEQSETKPKAKQSQNSAARECKAAAPVGAAATAKTTDKSKAQPLPSSKSAPIVEQNCDNSKRSSGGKNVLSVTKSGATSKLPAPRSTEPELPKGSAYAFGNSFKPRARLKRKPSVEPITMSSQSAASTTANAKTSAKPSAKPATSSSKKSASGTSTQQTSLANEQRKSSRLAQSAQTIKAMPVSKSTDSTVLTTKFQNVKENLNACSNSKTLVEELVATKQKRKVLKTFKDNNNNNNNNNNKNSASTAKAPVQTPATNTKSPQRATTMNSTKPLASERQTPNTAPGTPTTSGVLAEASKQDTIWQASSHLDNVDKLLSESEAAGRRIADTLFSPLSAFEQTPMQATEVSGVSPALYSKFTKFNQISDNASFWMHLSTAEQAAAAEQQFLTLTAAISEQAGRCCTERTKTQADNSPSCCTPRRMKNNNNSKNSSSSSSNNNASKNSGSGCNAYDSYMRHFQKQRMSHKKQLQIIAASSASAVGTQCAPIKAACAQRRSPATSPLRDKPNTRLTRLRSTTPTRTPINLKLWGTPAGSAPLTNIDKMLALDCQKAKKPTCPPRQPKMCCYVLRKKAPPRQKTNVSTNVKRIVKRTLDKTKVMGTPVRTAVPSLSLNADNAVMDNSLAPECCECYLARLGQQDCEQADKQASLMEPGEVKHKLSQLVLAAQTASRHVARCTCLLRHLEESAVRTASARQSAESVEQAPEHTARRLTPTVADELLQPAVSLEERTTPRNSAHSARQQSLTSYNDTPQLFSATPRDSLFIAASKGSMQHGLPPGVPPISFTNANTDSALRIGGITAPPAQRLPAMPMRQSAQAKPSLSTIYETEPCDCYRCTQCHARETADSACGKPTLAKTMHRAMSSYSLPVMRNNTPQVHFEDEQLMQSPLTASESNEERPLHQHLRERHACTCGRRYARVESLPEISLTHEQPNSRDMLASEDQENCCQCRWPTNVQIPRTPLSNITSNVAANRQQIMEQRQRQSATAQQERCLPKQTPQQQSQQQQQQQQQKMKAHLTEQSSSIWNCINYQAAGAQPQLLQPSTLPMGQRSAASPDYATVNTSKPQQQQFANEKNNRENNCCCQLAEQFRDLLNSTEELALPQQQTAARNAQYSTPPGADTPMSDGDSNETDEEMTTLDAVNEELDEVSINVLESKEQIFEQLTTLLEKVKSIPVCKCQKLAKLLNKFNDIVAHMCKRQALAGRTQQSLQAKAFLNCYEC